MSAGTLGDLNLRQSLVHPVQGFVTDISSKQGCQAERAFPASITAVMNTNLGHRRFWQDLLVAKQHTKEGTKLGKD